MTKITPPPVYAEMVGDDAKVNLQWLLFFNQLYSGDTGTSWTPTFTNLTISGTPTITGKYFKIGALTYFWVRIVPATSTTSTAGTTYIDNFPLSVVSDGACLAVSGLLGGSAGQIEAGTNRIYVPAWLAVTVPLTVVGLCEAG